MKPAPFAYLRPGSLTEAVAALAGEPGAKVLAGGQSLVPLLSMRLAAPSMLVDINGLPGLDAIDVQETDAEYLVKADLPEVARNDVKVAIDDGVLTVEGERKQEKEEKGKKFHRVERTYGKFVRRMAVPADVDPIKVAAEFKDGVLNVHLPKSPTAKPRAIDVKIA